MRAKIRQYEKIARLLEPNVRQRALLAEETGRYCQRFLEQLGDRPAYEPNQGNPDALLKMSIDDEPLALDKLLNLFDNEIRKPGINPASGGHLGYIPGGGIFHAALGDYLADITNKYAGVYFASPGAVRR